MAISALQARAARTMLKLDGNSVVEATGISKTPLYQFEAEGKGLSLEKRNTLQKFYESRGIEFLDYDGVRPRPSSTILHLEGQEGFKVFMHDVMSVAQTQGGDICVSGVDEREFEKWQGSYAEEYLRAMEQIREKNPFTFRILIREHDDYFTASAYAQYKAVPEQHFAATPFYVYGDRLAMILFEPDDVTIYIVQSEKLADAQRKQFTTVWESL